jgi:D-threo-aldose 1-dehydrogenase
LSERRFGGALAGRPRDAYAVSTKVGRLLVDNPGAGSQTASPTASTCPHDATRATVFGGTAVRTYRLESSL